MAFHRIFSFYGNLYIHKHWEFHGFSSTLNLRGSENYGKSLCFLLLFPYYVNSLFPYFGNCMDFCFTQNIWETHYFGMFVFSHIFLYYGNSLFPYFGNCMDFCFTQNNGETHYFGIFVFFPYVYRIMEIHFSQGLGIVWISASSEIFKKPINFKCLCFPILFLYNGNSLFPCFGNFRNT